MQLKMQGITKSFKSNCVLHHVDFSLNEGEICALLGENGAGKSTLMNILGGVLPKDEGEIYLDGQKTNFKAPEDSLQKGIAFIHQELNLINDLPVYENMFIGNEIKKKNGFLDHQQMILKTQQVFDQMDVTLSPTKMVRDLDASYKQIVEIARALLMNAKIIIMDEPTTSLTTPEIEHVFSLLKKLKKDNVSIIFISHKLKEVIELCDRFAVLRDGIMVKEGLVQDVTTSDLALYMVGHHIKQEKKTALSHQEEFLRLNNLSLPPYYEHISLSAYQGEVLGITGLLGDGRSELFQTVFGVLKKKSGDIYINDQKVHIVSPEHALKLGIAYVPKNRKENGIIKDLSILENGTIVSLKHFVKGLFISKDKQEQAFLKQKQALKIKMEQNNDSILSLSGGNQQKVVLAKWLMQHPKLLILDNPTQGVDVGAKEEIYEIITALKQQGVCVIVLSSEAQEILRICDRAYVMYHGKIMAEVKDQTMTEHNIMHLQTGG